MRKGKQSLTSRLYFFRHGTLSGLGGSAGGDPFEKPFAEFARAYIRYHHAAAPLGFGSLRARINALSQISMRHSSLWAVFRM